MNIVFVLNGESVHLQNGNPTMTLLDWLRETQGLTGTKEGCNEGDCGACTVIVIDEENIKPLNACILFLPQIHGKAIRTVEGVGIGGALHPVQSAMVECHGSQCGFCTPGFITSMVAAQMNDDDDHHTTLAGNLCRCTGYAPILKAAQRAASIPQPPWLLSDREALEALKAVDLNDPARPQNADALAQRLRDFPKTTLVAGGTDVGLWVTKQFQDLGEVTFLTQVSDLRQIEELENHTRIGAMVSIEQMRLWALKKNRSLSDLLQRYGSTQIRMAATIGGNIANGSPIGDGPPALIAMGAILELRKEEHTRQIPLEDFFIAYGRQDLSDGEFVQAILVPNTLDHLRFYKISKRLDQDISALCGAFCVSRDGEGRVTDAKIAFGGMAAVPKRAENAEKALIRKPWSLDALVQAAAALDNDFTPISDMRASADYRMMAAKNLFIRYFYDIEGVQTQIKEVSV